MNISSHSRNTLYMFIAAVVISTTFFFNNCSNAVYSTTGVNKLAPPVVVLDIIKKCDEAEAAGKLITAQQFIEFKDTGVESGRPGNICEFEKDDNLSMAEGELRARYTQTKKISLPPNAVLCGLKMHSDVQNFRYDDVFFLTFNGHLLASNEKTAVDQRLSLQALNLPITKQNINVYQYDWLKVRTAPFQNQNVDDYCIGAVNGISTCQWPLTEKSGKIQLDFSQEVLVAMSAQKLEQTLQFIITGDNNPDIDCYHQKLILDAEVKYFIPK